MRRRCPSSSYFLAFRSASWSIVMGENLCGLSDSRCSLEPSCMVDASRGTDDALVLIIEAVSKSLLEPVMDMGCEVLDIPDTGVGPDLMEADDCGRLSGKSAFTNVRSSVGLITRYGWTSAVSRSEVIDLAGNSLAAGTRGLVP